MEAVAVVDPAGQAYPATQSPDHTHNNKRETVGCTLAGQGGGGRQGTVLHASNAPVQVLVVAAGRPYLPAAHWPLQAAEVEAPVPKSPAGQLLQDPADPVLKVPATQGVHALAPALLYWPAGHALAVALEEPVGQ